MGHLLCEQDGTRIQLKSMSNGQAKGLYMVAEGGGGSVMACNRTTPQAWETFKVGLTTSTFCKPQTEVKSAEHS